MTGPVDTAREAWGDDLPDWVLVLAEACQAESQAKVAARLGRSGAMVSTVLRRKYGADLAAVEELVRGKLMAATCDCPALGVIGQHDCQEWRRKARAFSGSNGLRVTMYRACHRCPRFRKEPEA